MKRVNVKSRASVGIVAIAGHASTEAPAPGNIDEMRFDTGSLQRGLAVLEAVIRAERPVSANEVGSLVGLSASTTHRLLKSLSEQGYVIRDSAKRYFPSVRALFPANLFHPLNVLRRVTIEHLLGLRNQFGLASSLLVFLGGKRWVIETIHGHDALSPYNEMEVTAPLHATAAGKILLSIFSEEERAEALGPGPYERLTSTTIVEPEKLRAELAKTVASGHAIALDEMLQGLSAVGAPVWYAPRRALGALVLAGPTRNFEGEKLTKLVASVCETAGILSHASPDVRTVGKLLGH
jgi:IclR family transcriptional regulator, acetate operon repressor